VIVSDALYDTEMFPFFRRALLGVTADLILMAYKKRLAVREVDFFRELEADFELYCLPQSALQPELRGTGVHLLVASRKQTQAQGRQVATRERTSSAHRWRLRVAVAAGALALVLAFAARGRCK
jgi:hypothetical protein